MTTGAAPIAGPSRMLHVPLTCLTSPQGGARAYWVNQEPVDRFTAVRHSYAHGTCNGLFTNDIIDWVNQQGLTLRPYVLRLNTLRYVTLRRPGSNWGNYV